MVKVPIKTFSSASQVYISNHNTLCFYTHKLSPYFSINPRNVLYLGGTPSDYGKHPWQASIRIKTDKVDYHLCGATIISHYHVITAAHCIEHPMELYVVR